MKPNLKSRELTVPSSRLIRNISRDKKDIGTLGGYMKDAFGRIVGVTCLHVAKGNISDWKNAIIGESDEIATEAGSTIGVISKMDITNKIDVAFIRINNSTDINNSHINNPKEFYEVKATDAGVLEVVIFSEKQNKTLEGVLIEPKITESVTFPFREAGIKSLEFIELMSISSSTKDGKNLTLKGDSGAWVRTKKDNKVIGIVVGASKDKTYVVRMSSILSDFPGFELL